MRIQFVYHNLIVFLFLKENVCSETIKESVLEPITSESINCTEEAHIKSVQTITPALEINANKIVIVPKVQSHTQTSSSSNNVFIKETTECLSKNQSLDLQETKIASPNANLVKELKNTAEQFDKAMVLESKDHNYLMMEAVNHSNFTNDELNNLFINLKYEPTQVPEFYDYFDVLGFIDKSITHIQSFLETLSGNYMANFFKTREGITDKIDSEFKFLKAFYEQVKKLYEAYSEKKIEFDFIEDELISIETRKSFIEKHYLEYRSFSYQDYLKAIFIKHNKLTNLETYLKKVRDVICPLCEEDIKKHADLFKTTFKIVVKEVYKKLSECHDKEKNILNFLFDILNDILKGIRECNNELEVIKNIIENNGKPSRDE